MKTKLRVLIPVEDAEHGTAASAALTPLLHADHWHLHLVHVMDRASVPTAAQQPREDLMDAARSLGATTRGAAGSGGSGVIATQQPGGSSTTPPAAVRSQLEDGERRKCRARLGALVQALERQGYGVTLRVRIGDLKREILVAADVDGVDLIALASRRRASLTSLGTAGLAERILLTATRPVLHVKL